MKALKKHWWLTGLFIALLVAVLSPLASSHPDGLERVAEDYGFIGKAQPAPLRIIADYVFPGIQNEAVATIAAGILGTLVMFAIGYGVAWALRRRAVSASRDRG